MKKLLVVLLVLGLAAPAMAADLSLYGGVRMNLGYHDVDEEYIGGPGADSTIFGNTIGLNADDDKGTILNLSGQSYFGARGKLSDAISVVAEVGLRETDENIYLRQFFGTWNFGAGSLLVGKTYTPAMFLGWSNMVGDIGDQGNAVMLLGSIPYIGRQPQIMLTVGGFQASLIEPNGAANNPIPTVLTGTVAGRDQDLDFDIPRIELAYTFRTPMIIVKPIAGFQTYEAENRLTGESEDITSYLLGLGVRLQLGPAYIAMSGSYYQNAGNYGEGNLMLVSPLNLPAALSPPVTQNSSILNARYIDGDIEDSELLYAHFVVGMRFSPTFGMELGFGYADASVDVDAGVEAEQTAMLYYLQAPITIAKGFQLIPEIGVMDRGDLEAGGLELDQGKMMYFDVSLRIDF